MKNKQSLGYVLMFLLACYPMYACLNFSLNQHPISSPLYGIVICVGAMFWFFLFSWIFIEILKLTQNEK